MKCAYDKDRDCNSECAAFLPNDTVRSSEMVWDTCLNEYVSKNNIIKTGDACKRMGYLIGVGKITHKDNMVIE